MTTLVFRYLQKNWIKNTLTGSAVALVVIIFGTIFAVISDFNSFFSNLHFKYSLTVRQRHFQIWTGNLPISYMRKLKRMKGVKEVTPLIIQDAKINNYDMTKTVLNACNPKIFHDILPNLFVNVPKRVLLKFYRTPNGALIGSGLLSNGIQAGQTIETTGSASASFKVIGINYSGMNTILIHQSYYRKIAHQNTVSGYLLDTFHNVSPSSVAWKIDKYFSAQPIKTRTVSTHDFFLTNYEFLKTLGKILFFIFILSFGTVVVIVANTLTGAVIERFPQIAVLKSIGFRTSHIFALVIMESVVLCCFAGIFSIPWIIVLPRFFPLYWENGRSFIANTDFFSLFFSFILAGCIGVTSGIAPAYAASKKTVKELQQI